MFRRQDERVVRGLLWSLVLATCAAAPWGSLRSGDSEKREAGPDGLMAWQQVYSVLTSPRCLNCHTATNYPQQGDGRHRHFANVVRGPQDKGVVALQCATCHPSANADSTGVPGAHNWHLAPLTMRWQDADDRPLPSAEVCRSVLRHLDGPHLVKHHEEEPLVLWAWQPGRRPDGSMRMPPPITHAEFVEATRQWVRAGTPCP